VSEQGSGDDNKLKKQFFQIALQACIVLSAFVGFIFFIKAIGNHTPLLEALEAFIPPVVFFVLLLLHHVMDLLTAHDLPTYMSIGTFIFSMYLAYRWVSEVDPSRRDAWAALCTGILGFSLGIPFTKFTGGRH
jgi:hypothetical protein